MAAPRSIVRPMTRMPGRIVLAARATPAASPPPDSGTRIVSRSGRACISSIPIVPWPAMTAGSSKGEISVRPSSRTSRSASACAASCDRPTIRASAPRRWLGVVSLCVLGLLLLYLALFMGADALGWQVFLIAMGVGSFAVADRMRRATARVLELTRQELRDDLGHVIARVEDIEHVDRSFFAFKPSNGFLIRTSRSAGRRTWQPGLWWRLGRRIGVGGVASAAQTKNAADILSVMLAERRGDL